MARPALHALLLLALSIGVRIRLLNPPALWFDDAWAAVVWKADGVLQAMQLSATAPAFGAIVKAWLSSVGFSPLAAQMPAFVIGVLLPPAAYLVALRLGLSRWGAGVVGLSLAGAPALVEASTHVKQYTLDAAVALGIVAVAWRLIDDPRDRRRWWWLAGAAILGMVLSTPAAVVAGAACFAAVLVTWRRRLPITPALAPAAIVVVGVGLTWLLVVSRFVRPGITAAFEPYLPDVDVGVSGFVESVARPAARIATAGLPFGVISIPIVAIVFGVLLWRDRDRFWLLALPIAGAFAAAIVRVAPVGMKRTDCYLYVALALALGLAVDRLGRWRPAAVAATIIAAAVTPFWRAHAPVAENIAPLVRTLERELAPGDSAIVLRSTSLSFGLYTTWPIALEPVEYPSHPGFHAIVLRPDVFTLRGTLRAPDPIRTQIADAVRGRDTVWVAASGSDLVWLPLIGETLEKLGLQRSATYLEQKAELTRWRRAMSEDRPAETPSVTAILGPAGLMAPFGLARGERGSLLAIEDLAHRITVFDVTMTSSHVMGGHGSGPGQLAWPDAAAVAATGEIFVADTGNNRVQVWRPDGGFVREFGRGGWLGRGLESPRDLVLAGNDVLVADYGRGRVRVFDRSGRRQRDITGAGTAGVLARPLGLARSADGEIFVSDAERHQIVVFDERGGFRRLIGRPGSGPGALHTPHGITLGPDGLLYVADHGHDRVQVFTTDGRSVRTIGRSGSAPGELKRPTDVLFLENGRLVVADNGNTRVQVWR